MANSKDYKENIYRAMSKVKMESLYKTKHALTLQLSNLTSREIKTYSHTETCTQILIDAAFLKDQERQRIGEERAGGT